MEKEFLLKKLKAIQQEIRDLRDEQDVVPCIEGEKRDICGYFDRVVDEIEDLIEKINERTSSK